ncbi:hypothetical protein V6N13_028938 [Hibiscus sabdariffa]|uniref:Uncharacterized protein n=1 Tax=Hibiscus sabdariffa TaxID=183260 RepID=A0ABR2NRP6_9ROSI
MFDGVCWYIWRSRNEFLFWVDDDVPQRLILERARVWLVTTGGVASHTAQPRSSLAVNRRGRVPWNLPPCGWVNSRSW